MTDHLRASLDQLKQHFGPMFYRYPIPGGLLTVWPTSEGWQHIAIPDRAEPRGELREVPKGRSNSRFTLAFHYTDEEQTGACWQHLIDGARDG